MRRFFTIAMLGLLGLLSGCQKEKERELFPLIENYPPPTVQDPSPAVKRHKPLAEEYAKVITPLPNSDHKARGVLIITADTLRSDHLSCYGNEQVLTPYIDRLAASGVLFRQTITAATTTTPSHASIFTGLYLQDHNAYSNYEAISNEVQTLFEQANGRGFRTFALSNMPHLNPEVSNIVQGVETFHNGNHPRRAHESFKIFLNWLDTLDDDEPFLAWVHLVDVHTPYRPPAPYNRFYYEGDENNPDIHSLEQIWPLLPTHMSDHPFFQRWLEGITDLAYVTAQYKGAVSYLDDEMGELYKELEKRHRLEDTALVFTADHGESLGEHDMYFIHFGLYESTLRVPLIMYLPGLPRRGIVVDNVVETVDIMPTILDYFGIPSPTNIRGQSLLPSIRGEIPSAERIAFTEHAGGSMVSLRGSRYKYIRHLRYSNVVPAYNLTPGTEELYDMEKDPQELNNLAESNPKLVKKFRALWRQKRGDRQDINAGEATIDRKTEEMLKSLGYIRE